VNPAKPSCQLKSCLPSEKPPLPLLANQGRAVFGAENEMAVKAEVSRWHATLRRPSRARHVFWFRFPVAAPAKRPYHRLISEAPPEPNLPETGICLPGSDGKHPLKLSVLGIGKSPGHAPWWPDGLTECLQNENDKPVPFFTLHFSATLGLGANLPFLP
jgi:hypothetical protein